MPFRENRKISEILIRARRCEWGAAVRTPLLLSNGKATGVMIVSQKTCLRIECCKMWKVCAIISVDFFSVKTQKSGAGLRRKLNGYKKKGAGEKK